METSNLIGKVLLSRYRVDRYIDSGGMGVVYKVWDLKRGVPLAMKVLKEDSIDDSLMVNLFQSEAQNLEQFPHPHIVPFYGFYKDQGLSFLLEGYIEGQSLKQMLWRRKGTPLPVPEALIILKVLCSALGYVHASDKVHCDVKPNNVMIDRSGLIYLTDFGIARRAYTTNTILRPLGTAAYMAPEQFNQEPVTPATDVYSLGVLLFELLTARLPFTGNEPEVAQEMPKDRLRAAHNTLTPPDPRSFNAEIPDTLAQAILKALQKTPHDRFTSTRQFFLKVCPDGDESIPDRFTAAVEPGLSVEPEPANTGSSLSGSLEGMPRMAGRKLPARAFMIGAGLMGLVVLAWLVTPGLLPRNQRGPTLTSAPQPVIQAAAQTARPTSSPSPTATATLSPAPTATLPNAPPPGADEWTSPIDGMVLVRIPAGEFLMGSDSSPWDFERPQHPVTLDEYWIDIVPVTNAMFTKFADQTRLITQAEKVGWGYVSPGKGEFNTEGANWKHPFGPTSNITGKENDPVVQVTWDEARNYCAWAGRRLLTEAEWEKAARGDDARPYPWGSEIDCMYANYASGSNTFCNNGLTPVDAYYQGASPYGVLDMAGNTWDWVADWYQWDYYTVSPAANPAGPATGEKKVHRGGAWYNFNLQVQTSYRYSNPPDWTFSSVGFRCGYSP